VKVILDQVIVIYELTFKGFELRINVFSFEDIIAEMELVGMNYLMNTKRWEVGQEEVRMTTKLNMDSFNYDYHLQVIFNQVFETSKHKDSKINVSYLIHHLLNFY